MFSQVETQMRLYFFLCFFYKKVAYYKFLFYFCRNNYQYVLLRTESNKEEKNGNIIKNA